MPIRQLQVANDSVQDRLILRIATQANEEIRAYLTRRFLRELWPHLASLLAGHLAPKAIEHRPAPVDGSPADPLPGEGASFEQSFIENNPTYPLGSTPLLTSEVGFDVSEPGIARLTLREGRERSFNLSLNTELLQALCSMLRAAAEQAGWDLALDYTRTASVTNAPSHSLLH